VLKEHREHEQNLRATLTTAQRLSDDIKTTAEKDGERILRDAEGRAQLLLRDAESRSQLLLDKTQARLEDVQREIDGLKLTRPTDVETTIESTIQTLRNTLEFVREQENRERDEKILFHRPRHAEAAELHEPRRVSSQPA